MEELIIGHEGELAELLMGEAVEILHDGLDEFLAGISIGVLDLFSELDEVVLTPIELISVEVVNLALRVTRTVPDLPGCMMAEDTG